jgi:hypothetical protein
MIETDDRLSAEAELLIRNVHECIITQLAERHTDDIRVLVAAMKECLPGGRLLTTRAKRPRAEGQELSRIRAARAKLDRAVEALRGARRKSLKSNTVARLIVDILGAMESYRLPKRGRGQPPGPNMVYVGETVCRVRDAAEEALTAIRRDAQEQTGARLPRFHVHVRHLAQRISIDFDRWQDDPRYPPKSGHDGWREEVVARCLFRRRTRPAEIEDIDDVVETGEAFAAQFLEELYGWSRTTAVKRAKNGGRLFEGAVNWRKN